MNILWGAEVPLIFLPPPVSYLTLDIILSPYVYLFSHWEKGNYFLYTTTYKAVVLQQTCQALMNVQVLLAKSILLFELVILIAEALDE